MRKTLFLLCIISAFLNIQMFAQEAEKIDSIPAAWYGSYHLNGEFEHPVLILQNKLIEFKGDEYWFKEGHYTDDGIYFNAASRSDSLLLNLKLDEHRLTLSGYPVEEEDLWNNWAMSTKSLDYSDLPERLIRDWMNATSGSGFWPFFIREEGMGAATTGPFIMPEEILINDDVYLVLCDNKRDHKYYFFKNIGSHHVDIALGTKEYNTYTSSMNLPKERPHTAVFPPDFWGDWFSSDGNNELMLTADKKEWILDEETYELANFHKVEDSLKIYLLKGRDAFPITITDLTPNYLVYQWASKDPVILKKNTTLMDGYLMNYDELPGWMFGYWYTTDGNNQTMLALEQDEMRYLDKKIKDLVIYKNQNLYHLEFSQRKNKFHFIVEPLSMEYLLVMTTDDQSLLLKHGKNNVDFMTISAEEIPKSYLGNWFNPKIQNAYEYTISKDYFIFDQALYEYDEINRGPNYLEIIASADQSRIHFTSTKVGDSYNFKIDKGLSHPIQKFRSLTIPNQNWPTQFPDSEYSKGGKFTLEGYVLNHDKYPDFSTVSLYWHAVIKSGQATNAAKIEEDGRFTLEIDLDHPLESFGRFGEAWINVFMAPGNKVFMVLDAEEFADRENPKVNLAITGDWAQEAYLYHDFNNYHKADWSTHRDHVANDDSTGYKTFRTDLFQEDLLRVDQYLSERSYSPFFKQWLNNQIDYSYIDDLMRYRWLKNSYNQERSPYQIPVSPKWLEWENFPLQNPQHCLNYKASSVVHEHYMYQNTHTMMDFYPDFPKLVLPKDDEGNEVSKTGYYMTFIDRVRKEESYSDYFRDILISRFLIGALSREKIEIIEPAVERFQNEAINQAAIDFVSKSVNTLKKYSEEEIDDHIVVETADTANMSLFEKLIYPHRGKVIYVDFWATWCGPCKSQFPYSRVLHDALKGKDVVFMYLCGSSERPNWKADIENFKLEGDHHFIEKKEWRELCGEYKVSGIPHYLIVDKTGKVVDEKAPRPQGSSGYNQDLYKKILKLLDE